MKINELYENVIIALSPLYRYMDAVEYNEQTLKYNWLSLNFVPQKSDIFIVYHCGTT
jgi:hypothetical protein